MTAINVFTFTDRAIVFTDGRRFNPLTQEAALAATKILPLPHLDAAIIASGMGLLSAVAWTFLQGNASTFDAATAAIGSVMRDIVASTRVTMPGPWNDKARLHLVGYSEREASFLDCVVSYGNDEAPDFEPQFLSGFQGPRTSECDEEAQAAAIRLMTGSINEAADGIALVQGQARSDPRMVGDFVQMATLERGHAEMRMLQRI